MQNRTPSSWAFVAGLGLCILSFLLFAFRRNAPPAEATVTQNESVVAHGTTPIAGAVTGPSIAVSPAPAMDASRPWWTTIPEAEAQQRRADFDFMYDQPGAFPEFSEIARQLADAGMPMEVVRMEARELLGALLERRTFSMTAGDRFLAANHEETEGGMIATRMIGDAFAIKAKEAEAELLGRLTNSGVPLDSTAAIRILQLEPKTPLRQLDEYKEPTASAGDRPGVDAEAVLAVETFLGVKPGEIVVGHSGAFGKRLPGK